MKKHYLLITVLVALAVISPACAKESDVDIQQEEETSQEEIAKDGLIQDPTDEPANGPCNNILFPLNEGNNWVYEIDSIDENGNPTTVEYAWSVSESTDTSIALGTLLYDSGTVVSTNVDCSEGSIQNFPVTASNIVLGDTEGSIQYEFISGKFLPSLQELDDENWENSWDTVVNSSGTISVNYDGESATIILEDSPITMNWHIVEKDVSVSVPAGQFDNAVLINQDMVYEIKSLKVDTGDIPIDISTSIKTNANYWFVPNLGLVKTEVKSTSISLFGSEFPWNSTGGSVLKSSSLLDN